MAGKEQLKSQWFSYLVQAKLSASVSTNVGQSFVENNRAAVQWPFDRRCLYMLSFFRSEYGVG